ncbi:hypothetical protein DFH11DRAFT_998817 [Phellopilus nigrolimitatus]|nr:hypothetical protein DFH11DRAFT_998817 [Phellopilus nigrolimitatus]
MGKLSSKTGIQLDRDSAPHLSAGGITLPNLREQSASMEARERDLQADLTFEAYKNPRRRDRPVRAMGVDIDYSRPTDRFESTDEGERNKRGQRDSFKLRGSVVERLRMGGAVEIPKHSRMHEDRMEAVKKAKKKPRAIRSVSLDVAIPSIVSVGNLARLLGVRLGVYNSASSVLSYANSHI